MNLGVTVIKGRRSVRQYKDTPIPENVIRDALDCARLAPTARNVQPWLFGVIDDAALKAGIAELTDHGKFIADAPICFAVFTRKEEPYYLEDGCAATDQLILGLWAHGVASCWVAGDKKGYAENVRELLAVPDGYTLIALVPAGYPAQITIPDKKKTEDIVFSNRWEPKSA
ncbi:MAG: nitroreductase family protein [Methanomicrobiales archaeon]|nr:nitroreductase family protein [Methanomicrobiales archaeon]